MSSEIADRIARGPVAAALVACAMIVAGCDGTTPAPAPVVDPTARPPAWGIPAADELLSPTRGVIVAERSGELSYPASSLNVIDADNSTHWLSPPKDTTQWVVLELPALTRVRRVGTSTGPPFPHAHPVKTLRFEGSIDGTTFTELRTIEVEREKNDQLFDIPPADVRFLRVTTLANHDAADVTVVPTIHAVGEELEPVARPSFAGRWSVNGQTLDLSQEGDVLYGVVAMEPPMIFCGTIAGRVARLAWSRGNESGVAWLSVNRTSSRINGLWWWIDPTLDFVLGEPWIGERTGDARRFTVPLPPIADVHLRKVGRFPLYGLVFGPDGELDLEASASGIAFIGQALQAFPSYKARLEIVACDSWIEAKNLEAGRARAAKLAAALERAGMPKERIVVQARSRIDLASPIKRLMFDQVEFSLAGN